MPRHFIRRQEDFVCANCGQKVVGSGYTNHCPRCLFSKHVDETVPGDRASDCQGLMEPIGVEVKGGEYIITYRCQKCGKQLRNKAVPEDNVEQLTALSTYL